MKRVDAVDDFQMREMIEIESMGLSAHEKLTLTCMLAAEVMRRRGKDYETLKAELKLTAAR